MMPPPMTTTSADVGSFAELSTVASGAGMRGSSSTHQIPIAVVSTDQGQKPWPPEVTRDGRPVEFAPRVQIESAIQNLGHDRAHQGRHLRAVAAVAHRVVKPIALAGPRQPVSRHVDHAAPAIVDPCVSEVRKHPYHGLAQYCAALHV